MSRHKPISPYQLSMMYRAQRHGEADVSSTRAQMIAKALISKGLATQRFYEGEWKNGRFYRWESYLLKLTPKGERYLRFVECVDRAQDESG